MYVLRPKAFVRVLNQPVGGAIREKRRTTKKERIVYCTNKYLVATNQSCTHVCMSYEQTALLVQDMYTYE